LAIGYFLFKIGLIIPRFVDKHLKRKKFFSFFPNLFVLFSGWHQLLRPSLAAGRLASQPEQPLSSGCAC